MPQLRWDVSEMEYGLPATDNKQKNCEYGLPDTEQTSRHIKGGLLGQVFLTFTLTDKNFVGTARHTTQIFVSNPAIF